MLKLIFKEDFSRLSFADLKAMHEVAIEYYEFYTLEKLDERASFFFKVSCALSSELELRLIEKFTLKTPVQ